MQVAEEAKLQEVPAEESKEEPPYEEPEEVAPKTAMFGGVLSQAHEQTDYYAAMTAQQFKGYD